MIGKAQRDRISWKHQRFQTPISIEFLSHKVFRWIAPLFLMGALVGSAFAPGTLYRWVFGGQVVFYAMAALGGVAGRPEWVFVKLHTHGAQEDAWDALLGRPMG